MVYIKLFDIYVVEPMYVYLNHMTSTT